MFFTSAGNVFMRVLLTFSCLSITTPAAYRIFAVEPIPGRSHWNVMSAILEQLIIAGHEVVCATLHTPTDFLVGHPNYTHVDMSKPLGTQVWRMNFTNLMNQFNSKIDMLKHFVDRERRFCKIFYQVAEINEMIHSSHRRFDAIVMESLFSECLTLLSSRLRLATIYVVSCPPINCIPMTMGSPENPSYMGTVLTVHSSPRTFNQRLINVVDYVRNNFIRWYRDAEIRREFEWPRPKNTMLFINTHHSIEPARPLSPNVQEIGGIHLKSPKPLPKDLAELMNENNEFGVIVFSFGSIVAINSIPENILDIFKSVFRHLPQTIIWKYESDDMINKPDNVVLCKWLPQRDILQHPNVKLFISHGGLSGLYEVVDAGIPVLGIPLFYDQPRNIQRLVDLGMALSLDINAMTKFTLSSTINQLLKNQNFAENAKRVSSRFHDRPMTPARSIVYWTEYLIEHGDQANIRPLSADASWTSYFMIDICISHVFIGLTFIFCIQLIIRNTRYHTISNQ